MSERLVYCAEMAEVSIIKIGVTHKLDQRLKTIWRDAPMRRLGVNYPEVSLLRTFPDEPRLEPALHYYFRNHRVKGEWFCSHGIKEALVALGEGTLPQLLREYWESYPRLGRPPEFRGPGPHDTSARQHSDTPCFQHRRCRHEQDWAAHKRDLARGGPGVFHLLQESVEF